jgi:hypothetical protein
MSTSISPLANTPAATVGDSREREGAGADPLSKAMGWIEDGLLERTIKSWTTPNGKIDASELAPGAMPNNAGVSVYAPTKSFGQAVSNAPAAAEGPRVRSTHGSGSHNVATGSTFGNNFQVQVGDGARSNKRESAGHHEHVSGNGDNGTRAVVQAGVWDQTSAKVRQDDIGGAVGGSALGGAGAMVQGGFSRTLGRTELDGLGTGWAGAQGRAFGAAAASGASGLYAGAGFEGRAGAGMDGEFRAERGLWNGALAGKVGVGAETSNGFHLGAQMVTPQERAAGVVGKTGIDASAGGFVGAKAEGSATAGVGGNTVTGAAAAYLGVGAEASVKTSIETDEKNRSYLNIGGRIGAALGVGGAISLNFRVNVTPLVKAFDAVKEAVPRVVESIRKFGQDVIEGVKDFGAKVFDTAKSVGKKVVDAAKDVGAKVGSFLKGLFGG